MAISVSFLLVVVYERRWLCGKLPLSCAYLARWDNEKISQACIHKQREREGNGRD